MIGTDLYPASNRKVTSVGERNDMILIYRITFSRRCIVKERLTWSFYIRCLTVIKFDAICS